MEKSTFLQDIEQIRWRARQDIELGPVTQDYEADRETVLRLLNEALATEIVCMLRYRRHYHTARGIHARPIAAEFLEHARDEESHAEQLAERIVQLGGNPDYNPDGILSRSHSEYVEGGGLIEMVREDLVAERIAIESYAAIARYLGFKDPTSRRVMEEILAKEEEHANDLADILADLGPARVDMSEQPMSDDEAPVSSTRETEPRVLGHEEGPLPRDVGYGPSHGYAPGHEGPSSPGDAPSVGRDAARSG
jgi:bacterioferritin